MNHLTTLTLGFMALLPLIARGDNPPAVKITEEPKTLEITIDGKPFTTYHFADDFKRPFVRPFFWPVLLADGTQITSDQTQAAPGKNGKIDHPHHRSIWVGLGDVNGADHWDFMANPQPKQRHVKFARVGADSFEEELDWESKDTKSIILHELRTVRALAFADGSRGIDLTSKFTAVNGDVTIGDTKEAGLAAVRVNGQIPEHKDTLTLINSKGEKGEKAVWGKPADWVDESGTIDGKTYGVAIFDDPKNPRFPTTWHAREYGLVAPNAFGLHEFDKKKNPEHAGDFKIANGQSETFHFRIVFHAGDAEAAKVAEKYKDFSAGK
jgi:hypothetical protein